MTGDELKRYRFPETLTNQSRWFGLYLDELIPAVICTRPDLLVSANLPS